MLKYTLVGAKIEEIEALVELVNEHLAKDWSPLGGLCVLPVHPKDSAYYLIQPMIKEVTTQVEWIDGEGKKRC